MSHITFALTIVFLLFVGEDEQDFEEGSGVGEWSSPKDLRCLRDMTLPKDYLFKENKEFFDENLTPSNLLFPFPVSSVEEFLSIKKRRPKVLVDQLKATTWNKDISFLCTRHDSVLKIYHLLTTTKTIDPPEISSLQRSSATFNLNITLNGATLYLFY